jgi:hypothetical protein
MCHFFSFVYYFISFLLLFYSFLNSYNNINNYYYHYIYCYNYYYHYIILFKIEKVPPSPLLYITRCRQTYFLIKILKSITQIPNSNIDLLNFYGKCVLIRFDDFWKSFYIILNNNKINL